MKQRFILFRRGGVYYSEDTTTRKQSSLRTKDEGEALTLLHSKNEAHRQPTLNLHIARTYLTATDPAVSKRTWQHVLNVIVESKKGSTQLRWQTAVTGQLLYLQLVSFGIGACVLLVSLWLVFNTKLFPNKTSFFALVRRPKSALAVCQ